MQTEEVSVYDIKTGDRILHFGLVLLVDREFSQTNHRVDDGGPTMATAALITNWDEGAGVDNLAEVDEEGNRRWVIQSNGRGRWTRILNDN
ncbi:hypothetical protein [Mycolicibacterium sp.]|uniref:hypothetical protein n=1 Tax=Mycolicibacterium sp. TaxID=2320850 RepID=UPI0037CC2F61